MRVLGTLFVAFGLCNAWSFTYSSKSNDALASRFRDRKETGKTIAEILRKEERFSKLAKALDRHGSLRDDLDSREHKFILFAPTDEAFDQLKHMPKGGSDEIDLERVLHYHMAKEHDHEIADRRNWYEGMLIETKLKEEKLGGRNQVARLSRQFGRWSLNIYSQIEDVEFNAANGVIFALDRVIVPPLDLFAVTRILPFELSTWTSAVLESRDLQEKLADKKELTLFAPSNRAFAQLGMKNIVYLFSKAGRHDLEKILKYHIATRVKYTAEIEESERLETLLGEEIDVEIVERGRKKDSRDYKRRHHSEEKRRHVLVDGWSRVIVTDYPAENGVLNIIDAVLIPDSVELPEEPYDVRSSSTSI